MSEVHLCPVCLGVGSVPPGFYDSPGSGTTSGAREQCRACGGNGIIIVRDTVYPREPRAKINWPADQGAGWKTVSAGSWEEN